MFKSAVIAHISDLHFGAIHDENAAGALLLDLVKDPKPDFIVVTGDISQFGREGELKDAKNFLEGILQQLLKDSNHRTRYVVIPGNHDVGLFKRLGTWNKIFGSWGGPGPNSNEPVDLFDYFRGEADDNKARELANEAIRFCEYYPSFQIAFLKFNSNLLRGGWLPNYARGKVGGKQLLKARRIITNYEKAFPEFGECRKIALVHHHVQYLPNTGSDVLMLMKDAGDFWKSMLDMRVDLILHGHKHYATHIGLKYIQSGQEAELMIVSAGSTTSKDQPSGQRCSYYKIICSPFKDTIQKYQLDGYHFTHACNPPIVSYHVPRFRIPNTAETINTHALELMLVPEDDEIDLYHRYTKIKCEATLEGTTTDRKLDYVGRYTFVGVNKSDESSTYLVVPLVAVGASKLKDLDPKAFDLKKNEPLPEPTIQGPSSDVDKFKLRISMSSIKPGDDFNIQLDFRLPKVMYREKDDYDAIGLTRFSQGVDEFEYILKTPYEPVEPRCYSIHRNSLRDLGSLNPTSETGFYIVSKKVKNPATLDFGFLFHYRYLR